MWQSSISHFFHAKRLSPARKKTARRATTTVFSFVQKKNKHTHTKNATKRNYTHHTHVERTNKQTNKQTNKSHPHPHTPAVYHQPDRRNNKLINKKDAAHDAAHEVENKPDRKPNQ